MYPEDMIKRINEFIIQTINDFQHTVYDNIYFKEQKFSPTLAKELYEHIIENLKYVFNDIIDEINNRIETEKQDSYHLGRCEGEDEARKEFEEKFEKKLKCSICRFCRVGTLILNDVSEIFTCNRCCRQFTLVEK